MAVELNVDDFAQTTAESIVTGRAKMPAGAFLDEADPYKKLALFGPPGSGKTLSFVDLLEAGERLFILSTDPGGNGLETVRNELKRRDREDLKKQIFYVDLFNYPDVLALWSDPYKYFDEALTKLDPTIAVWEGFSAFQVHLVDEYIMPDELRPEKELGLDPFVYWDKVRRATQRVHGKFLATHGREHGWHHILTCHESDPQDEDLKQKKAAKKRRAWIVGQSAKLVEAAYDLIIQCYSEEEFDPNTMTSKLKYQYRLRGVSDNVSVKSRGYAVDDTMPASMATLWKAVKGE